MYIKLSTNQLVKGKRTYKQPRATGKQRRNEDQETETELEKVNKLERDLGRQAAGVPVVVGWEEVGS